MLRTVCGFDALIDSIPSVRLYTTKYTNPPWSTSFINNRSCMTTHKYRKIVEQYIITHIY